MSKSSWGVFVSVAFAVAQAFLPVPEGLRPFIGAIALTALVFAVAGWIVAHVASLQAVLTRNWARHPMMYLLVGVLGASIAILTYRLSLPSPLASPGEAGSKTAIADTGQSRAPSLPDAAPPSVVGPEAVKNEPLKPTGKVALRFVHPTAPALLLVNESEMVLRDIKWSVAIWNLDLPNQINPFPIPTSTFDWIRPKQRGGPISLFDPPNIASQLTAGNRLFGSATVDCPDCPVTRTYVVYVVWGQGGWFCEATNNPKGSFFFVERKPEAAPGDFQKFLDEAFPKDQRLPIGPATNDSASASGQENHHPVAPERPASGHTMWGETPDITIAKLTAMVQIARVRLVWDPQAQGLHLQAINDTPVAIHDFHVHVTNVQQWATSHNTFADGPDLHQHGPFVPVELTGSGPLFHSRPVQFMFLQSDNEKLIFAGKRAATTDTRYIRTAGIWRAQFRCESGSNSVDRELFFSWQPHTNATPAQDPSRT